jgi:cell division protein FtsB
LRRKIEREIREYENVEKAYQKIKASTGLNDTREIVHRFVNREQTYSELLISIADYEKKIGVLKKHNEQLKSTIQSLKDQNGPSERYREDKGEFRSDLPQVNYSLSRLPLI